MLRGEGVGATRGFTLDPPRQVGEVNIEWEARARRERLDATNQHTDSYAGPC